ncbi:MAG: hypothetical protein GX596_02490 [Propionibacterium sp.]|nr:hypothetical protein [Propionibacterium sp.]
MKRFHLLPAGTLVVAGVLALGISLTPAAEVPRYTQVTPPRDSLIACLPIEDGTLFADGAEDLSLDGAEPRPAPFAAQVSEVTTLRGVAPSGGILGEALYSPCQAPATSGFLALPAAGDAELRLTNTDSSDASVDLTLLGPDGEVVGLGARGIALAPGESRPVALSVIAEGVDGPLGVEWHTTRGRVTATGVTTGDISHVAPSAPAADVQVLPGVREGATPTLVLVNPQVDRATVHVDFHSPTGTITPEGGQDISIPPRSVVSVDLSAGTGGEAGAFTVESDLDVVATLYAGGEAQGVGVAATPDVELAGAVPGSSTLQLTNVGSATASVSIALGESTHDLLIEPGATATQAVAEGDLVDVDVTSNQPLVGAAVLPGAIVELSPGSLAEAEPMNAELVPTLR